MENSFPSEQKKKWTFRHLLEEIRSKKKKKQNKWYITGSDVWNLKKQPTDQTNKNSD